MQTTLQGVVTGVSKYEIDGSIKGASLYMNQSTSARNPNVIGQETLKLVLPFEMFEQMRVHEQGFLNNATFQIDADIESGGQNKPKITVLAIRQVQIKEEKPSVIPNK
ncbi:MAG: hypothetical protein IBX55_17705 [Methyloprofundus sp.]|nr:hypothetical protein [Methyloprofundus sp.]